MTYLPFRPIASSLNVACGKAGKTLRMGLGTRLLQALMKDNVSDTFAMNCLISNIIICT